MEYNVLLFSPFRLDFHQAAENLILEALSLLCLALPVKRLSFLEDGFQACLCFQMVLEKVLSIKYFSPVLLSLTLIKSFYAVMAFLRYVSIGRRLVGPRVSPSHASCTSKFVVLCWQIFYNSLNNRSYNLVWVNVQDYNPIGSAHADSLPAFFLTNVCPACCAAIRAQ